MSLIEVQGWFAFLKVKQEKEKAHARANNISRHR